jgi:nitrogen regulatory protein P-II 1
MKLIEAIINTDKLSEVTDALRTLRCSGMTVVEVKGGGETRVFKGAQGAVQYDVQHVMITCIVVDGDVQIYTDAIARAAKMGGIESGTIFVSPVDEVIRIRTGERDYDAIK